MHSWRLCLLIIILGLTVAACSPASNNQPLDAQAAQLPVAAQNTTAAPTLSAQSNSIASTNALTASQASADTCSVTPPPDPSFTPPPPYPQAPFAGEFWYGADSLWTSLPENGVWSGLPHNPEGYTQKVFWWRKGYSWQDRSESQLSVTGRRLDAPAPPLNVSRATNAFAQDIGSAMLVGVDFPTLGCWEISGRYAGAELSFVIRIAP